jgi:hypothetical protein
MMAYSDTWNDQCISDVRSVVARVSVSHANRERQFIRGSFQGQLSVRRGMTRLVGSAGEGAAADGRAA